MKRIILLALALTQGSFAYGNYVSMTCEEVGQIDFQWKVCSCSNWGGDFSIQINARGFCPFTIKYFPQTQTWSK